MKALVRKKNEFILESYCVPGINWNTGYPLTDPKWAGGPYTLVKNFTPPQKVPEGYEEIVVEPEQVQVEEEIEDEDDYVIIDGKKYSKEELRSLLE